MPVCEYVCPFVQLFAIAVATGFVANSSCIYSVNMLAFLDLLLLVWPQVSLLVVFCLSYP